MAEKKVSAEFLVGGSVLRVKLSHQLIEEIKKDGRGDTASAFLSFVGTSIAVTGGAAAIAAPVIAGYVALQWIAIKNKDKGQGVYLTGPSPLLSVAGSVIMVPSTITSRKKDGFIEKADKKVKEMEDDFKKSLNEAKDEIKKGTRKFKNFLGF